MEAATDDEWEQIAKEELEWRKREDGWEIQKEIETQLRERHEPQ
jgi:hypothetical protein